MDIAMPERRRKLTIDNSTVASNPGKIRFKPLVWLKYKWPTASLFLLALVIMALLAVFTDHVVFNVLAIVAVVVNVIYWIRCKEHFTADSNPGLVISIHPPLVAVWTDLTKGIGNFPVIKVIPYKVKRAIELDDHIGTVAVYSHGNGPHWSDFNPIPIEYATEDRRDIDREVDNYEEWQWGVLQEGIAELARPYRPGLFRVHEAESDWNQVG